MTTQFESKQVSKVVETLLENEYPMQERYRVEVAESIEVTAEAIFTARKLEAQEEAGPVFVP